MAIEKVEQQPAPLATGGMSPVVAAVLARNPDTATLRECLAIQREYEREEARRLYVTAFVNLKADLPKILGRDKLVKFNNTEYTHTSLGAAVEAVTPHLNNYGFAHDWRPSIDDRGQVVVSCRLTHIGSHYEEVTIKSAPDSKGAKSGPQAIASTITMLERYTLLALLGIATADMEEPKGGSQHTEEKPSVQQQPGDDKAMNAKAVRWLIQQGRTVAAAEEHIGRAADEWTQVDRQRLKSWVKGTEDRDPGEEG